MLNIKKKQEIVNFLNEFNPPCIDEPTIKEKDFCSLANCPFFKKITLRNPNISISLGLGMKLCDILEKTVFDWRLKNQCQLRH